MPTIPMYQSSNTPTGIVQSAPSRAGQLAGQRVEQAAGVVGALTGAATKAVNTYQAEQKAARRQAEEKRLQDIDFENRSWAARKFSEAQLAAVDYINKTQSGRQAGQINTADLVRSTGESWMREALEGAPSEDALRYAEQNIRTTWANAERTAMESDDDYRKNWSIRQFSDANEAHQIAIQSAAPSMVDDSFVAAAANISGSLANMGLDPETKAKLGEKMLSESTIRAGMRIIQAEGPEKFFDAISGVHKTMTGKKKVTRPANGRWSVEIQQAAEETGVDPTLIEAVMGAESSGDPGVMSKRGAVGLMQLMPDTAQEVGVDPTRPEENILGGARYLAKMLKRYGGNEAKAIAAYNAGPGRVDKAGGVPNLPETKAYVERVTKDRERFKAAAGELQIGASNIPAWWQAATADDRDRLIGTAIRMQQELAAANLESLNTWGRNADAAQANGLPIPAPPSMDVVRSAFSGDEGKAARYYQQRIEPFQAVQKISSRMGAMSLDEMDRQIETLRPKGGRADDPNLAADVARFKAAEEARRNILEQRSRDPMAQALQQPSVQHLKTSEQKLDAALAWQKANVPEKARRILLDADREKLESAWMDPKASGGGLAVIDELQVKYGSHFGDALVEIAPKATPDALLFAGMNNDRFTAPARSRLRALASKSFDEVMVGNEPKKKLLESSVSKSFAPLFSSVKQTNSIEGSKYVENILPAIHKYAGSLMNAGLSPSQASQRAFAELVTSQYDFVDGGRAPGGRAVVRIPRAIGQDDLLRSRIEDGLDEALARPPKELAFPAGVSRADVLDEAYWSTSANDMGAVLMFRGAPVRVVREGKLVPFELSWSAIANAGERYQQNR